MENLSKQELLYEIDILKTIISDLYDCKREQKMKIKDLEQEILRLMKIIKEKGE